MFKDTITVFNRYIDILGATTWYPTVIHDVNVNIDKASIIAKYGTESRDSVVLNVPYKIIDEVKKVARKAYLPPKEWENQTNNMLQVTITFTDDAEEFDFFYVGEWLNATPIKDDDYGREGFYNYMNDRYDYVFAITKVAEYSVIPHFEIMGA